MDIALPHFNFKPNTFVEVQCLKCKQSREFETTEKNQEEINKLIDESECKCKQEKVK